LIVKQINISTSEGDMGILAGHIPSILQLRPGALVVIPESNDTSSGGQGETKGDVFFASGGFVTVNPDSTVQIAALEAVRLEEVSRERVEVGLKDAQERIGRASNKNVNDPEGVDAQIHAEVFQALSYALGKYQS
jgi:F-type H+-transporting ATPase subunit delta